MQVSLSQLKHKYKSLPKSVKATSWFTLCNFFLAGLGFITGPIFTRLIPSNEYGILTQYLTYEQLILIIATWEIQNGAYQRGLFRYEDKWNGFTISTLMLVNTLTLVCFAIILIFVGPISEFTRFTKLTLILLFAYLIVQPGYYCWITRKRTKYEYKPVVTVTILMSLANIILPMVTVYFISATATMRFNTTLAVSTLGYLFFYVTSLTKRKDALPWEETKAQWKYMIAYQAPLVLHSLSYLVLGQADRVMIGRMVGDSEAAFYGVAYTLASAVTILQSSLNQALTPWRFQKLQEKNYAIVRTSTNSLLTVFAGAIMMLVLIAPELMKLLFTDEYYEAVWSIPPVSTGIFFMFLYSVFVSVESYYEKTQYIMYVSITCGLLNVLLNYICIPIWGYIACGYTTLLSYVLFAVLHYVSMKYVCKKAIPGVQIFSLKAIVGISIAVLVVMVLLTLLYPYWIVRYVILLGMMIVAYIYRERIKQIISLARKKSE